MKKKIKMKKIIILMLPAIFLVSCVKSLDDYNIDTKRPVSVSAGSLFVNGTKVLTDLLTTPNVNTNVFRFYMQQWSATTYTDEPRYDFETRNIPLNIWNPMYRTVLINLQESKKVAEEDALTNAAVKANQVAATEVLSVLAWSILVNIWGDIPYTEALGEANQPKYDDAKTIYADLFARLNTAIGQMTPSAGGFGSSDLIYGGNTAQWLKFANSLKLRLAITIADVDATSAKTAFDAAKDNAFASNDDNAAFGYLSATPNNNPISNNLVPPFTSRQDYIIASTIVDEMNALADPRRDFYFSNKIDGEYKGSTPGSVAPYGLFSHVSDKITAPDFEALLIDFSEVQFIKAEAAARGWGGDASALYKEAITASMEYWGVVGADITTYLARPDVNIAITSANYKEIIGNQKWLALYNRGYDAWVEWRRLDFPKLTPAVSQKNPFPLRYPYTTGEYNLNGANVAEAAAKITGGDKADSKVFWDVN
jgi:hypothetical protein